MEDLKALFDKHRPEAEALPPERLIRPAFRVSVHLREANGFNRLAAQYWDAGPNGAPALSIAQARYSRDRLTRFDELIKATQYAAGLENLATDDVVRLGAQVQRATHLIDELEAAIDFILDDDVHEPADDRLDALHATPEGGSSAATIGQQLLAWLLLATDLQDRLAQLGDFDPALLTEARTLVDALTGAAPPTTAQRAPLTVVRKGLLSLMLAEQAALNRAAHYVWRHHPDLRRLFTSAEARKRRALNRLTKKLAEADSPPQPLPQPTP